MCNHFRDGSRSQIIGGQSSLRLDSIAPTCSHIDLQDVHKSVESLLDQGEITHEGLQAKPADKAANHVLHEKGRLDVLELGQQRDVALGNWVDPAPHLPIEGLTQGDLRAHSSHEFERERKSFLNLLVNDCKTRA